MAALVGEQGADACGHAEAESVNKWIAEFDSCQVQVGVGVEEGSDLFLGFKKAGRGFGEAGAGGRLDDCGSFDFAAGFYGWFEEADEEAAEWAWFGCAAPHLLLCSGG